VSDRNTPAGHVLISLTIIDGKFGAYMQVHIENDGPVTINLESPEQKDTDREVDK